MDLKAVGWALSIVALIVAVELAILAFRGLSGDGLFGLSLILLGVLVQAALLNPVTAPYMMDPKAVLLDGLMAVAFSTALMFPGLQLLASPLAVGATPETTVIAVH
ncbi:MAG TPA: hypothetical protein VGF56_09480 [Rhizomicrobium sp.]|jgi:hypothetical protein